MRSDITLIGFQPCTYDPTRIAMFMNHGVASPWKIICMIQEGQSGSSNTAVSCQMPIMKVRHVVITHGLDKYCAVCTRYVHGRRATAAVHRIFTCTFG